MHNNSNHLSFHSLSISECISNLNSTSNGLSSKEAAKRLQIYGPNHIENTKKHSIIACFFSQFKDFMIVILIFAAIISFVVSVLEGNADYVDPIIILAIIIVNAVLGTIQESKADHSLEALKKLSSPNACVIRDGNTSIIPAREVVPGDIIILETGNFVPADARLISSTSLSVDEASLTGESHPSNKNAETTLPAKSSIGDHKNMVYSSCIVVGGRGKAIVTNTGINTQVGHIAKMIIEDNVPLTPLQIRLAKTSKILGISALLICIFIFFIGIFTGRPLFEMFMTSVSLAVASIPEGLPIFITIMLSMGVTKMAARNAIIRKLPAVETLGSATYICSDKTGTLTQNKMTVTSMKDLSGNIKNPEFILSLAAQCNNTSINKNKVIGLPTETSLINAALDNGISINKLTKNAKRVYEIPFDSKRKMMTTVHKLSPNSYRVICKGAPDFLLKKCSSYYPNNQPLTSSSISKVNSINKSMASEALRVIAVAYKDISTSPNALSDNDLESNLIFVGLIGIIDPPRPEVKEAVSNCKSAGITPIMITGDHPLTACAIASEIGIMSPNDKNSYITGEELNNMSDTDLNNKVMNYKVFARVSPIHKVRIVKALQFNKQIVAMTGDGVNDAPALKAADIGCAMGCNGTDVAKNASDMILADDNFATIVEAVKEGRGIYENIKKSIHFLLSSNIGEIITILFAILFGLPTPLLAVQLLWINLITDSLPAIALGSEPISKEIMTRKPIHQKESFFSRDLTSKIIIEGIMIGSLALLTFIIGYRVLHIDNVIRLDIARTMCFTVLGLSQLFHSFNMKSDKSLSKINIFNNQKLIGAFIICVLLQIMVISLEGPARLFSVVPLSTVQWGIVFGMSFLPIPIVELQKRLNKA